MNNSPREREREREDKDWRGCLFAHTVATRTTKILSSTSLPPLARSTAPSPTPAAAGRRVGVLPHPTTRCGRRKGIRSKRRPAKSSLQLKFEPYFPTLQKTVTTIDHMPTTSPVTFTQISSKLRHCWPTHLERKDRSSRPYGSTIHSKSSLELLQNPNTFGTTFAYCAPSFACILRELP